MLSIGWHWCTLGKFEEISTAEEAMPEKSYPTCVWEKENSDITP